MTLTHSTRVDVQSDSETGTVTITAAPNQAALINPPTLTPSNTTSRAIATCGWTALNFAPKGTLVANKWVKTDASGKIVSTDDTPVVLNSSATGFLYNTAGTLSYLAFGTGLNNVARGNHTHNTSQLNNDAGFVNAAGVEAIIDNDGLISEDDLADTLEGYVTLDTDQLITGTKTFGASANSGIEMTYTNNQNQINFKRWSILNCPNGNTISLASGGKSITLN